MEIYINRGHLLKQIDYPDRYRQKNLVKTAAVIFGAVLVFLLLFKPFGVYEPEQKINYFLICCLHALTPALILYSYFGTLNYLRVKYPQWASWTLLREYGQIGIVLFFTGIGSFLIRGLIYQNVNNWSWYYLWEEIRNCFAAGMLFYLFLRLAVFYFQAKKDNALVIQFTPLVCESGKTVANNLVAIKTKVKQDDFNLDLNNLLLVKADGNYIELITFNGKQVNTELKRISLTQFESQVCDHVHLFRCHRAYLINMFLIEKVTGNAQGYLLSLNAIDTKVPVSRAQLLSFNNRYQQIRQQYNT